MMILAANPIYCLDPFEDVLNTIQEHFDGWEFLCEKEHGWDNREEIRDLLSTTDTEIQIHAPFNDINIASMNPRMRSAAVDEITKCFEMANMLDVEKVTVHPGVKSPIGRYCKETKEFAIESLIDIKIAADEFGLTAPLENMPDLWATTCITPEDVSEHLDRTGMPFCLDVGHANTAGRLDDFLSFKPVNIHLNDNVGEKDLHLPLGEGEIDFEYVMKRLSGYNGNIVIEGRSMDGLIKSKKYLEDILNKI
ncbi:MAG: sugar phosphate isomerase/epimerase family protein [Thermoplasmata archaeon]